MTPKQELRKLEGERKRLLKRLDQIEIRTGQLQARLQVKAQKKREVEE